MRHDLHVHTTASDGLDTPAEVVRAARMADLAGIAVTDHDTTAGVAEAIAEGAVAGLEVIPAVEITADAPIFECHILGYFIDPLEGAVHARLAALRAARVERAREILRLLGEGGIELTEAEVAVSAGDKTVQRPDIARALVAKGYAGDVREAMRRYLSRKSPAYVPAPSIAPAEAIALIRADGGVAVLAHPGTIGQDHLIEELAGVGLAGLEVHHPAHRPEHVARYKATATRLGLVATGGSDYHGARSDWRAVIGACGVGSAIVDELRGRRGEGWTGRA